MFAASKTSTPSGGTPDPQFNYVTMLLHGDGTNGAQNNTFLDSSTNNFTITRNGNTTQGSFSPYGSNWSNNFGSANFFYSASNAAFAFGTGDFTVEAWVNPSSYGTLSYVLGVAVTDGLVFYVNSGNLVVRAYNTGDLLSSSTIPAIGAWTHVAATRSGTTLRIFVNGVQTATTTNSTNFAQGAIYAGNDSTNAAPWFGYISNLRVVKGTAVYTSNFTPSTTPLTAVSGTSWLVCQSNRFVDNSSNAFAITTSGTPSVQRFNPFGTSTAYSTSVIGGSGYFDGTDDYLSYTQQTYSGNFTMECWFYQIASSSSYAMLFSVGGANTQLMIDYSGTGKITFYYNGTVISSASNVFIRNQWNHIAYVRSGSTITIYYNGTSVASGTLSDAIPISYIGGYSSSGYTLNGYMSDVRITTSALYTTTFTPPTAPLTAVSGTSILLNYTNGAIFDNAMMNDLETVGNAQISTSVVKYGTGSLAFDGTGDSLSVLNKPTSTVWGTESWTIEGWIYPTAVSASYRTIYANGYPVQIYQLNGSIEIYISSTNGFSYIVNGLTGPASSVTANTWVHFAVVKNGSAYRVYVNGVGGSTVTDATAIAYTSTTNAIIGDAPFGSYPFVGYIDDFRITKGYARYTANFTPPTAAFSNTGPI